MASERCWSVHSARNKGRQQHSPIVWTLPTTSAAVVAGVDPLRAMVSGRCLHLDAFLRDAVDASAKISPGHVRDHTRIKLTARSIMSSVHVHTSNSVRSKGSGMSSGASSFSHDEHDDCDNVCSRSFAPLVRPTCLGAKYLKASKEVNSPLFPCALAYWSIF